MKIIQYTKDGSRAVVLCRDHGDGFRILEVYAPKGDDWSTSTPFFITKCRDSLTPRILAIEPLDVSMENEDE